MEWEEEWEVAWEEEGEDDSGGHGGFKLTSEKELGCPSTNIVV